MRLSTVVLLSLAAAIGCGPARKAAEPKQAPGFDLPDLNGGRTTLASLRGKIVVLDFWATWCGPCIEEIPEYAAFWRKNQPRGIEVIGIVMDSGSPQEISDFVREYRIPYRQLIGNDETGDAFGVNQGFPTTFVIDAKGVIRQKFLGSPPSKFEKLQALVDAALTS